MNAQHTQCSWGNEGEQKERVGGGGIRCSANLITLIVRRPADPPSSHTAHAGRSSTLSHSVMAGAVALATQATATPPLPLIGPHRSLTTAPRHYTRRLTFSGHGGTPSPPPLSCLPSLPQRAPASLKKKRAVDRTILLVPSPLAVAVNSHSAGRYIYTYKLCKLNQAIIQYLERSRKLSTQSCSGNITQKAGGCKAERKKKKNAPTVLQESNRQLNLE